MITTAMSVAGSYRRKDDDCYTSYKGRPRRYISTPCPECGCRLHERVGKYGLFSSCERFPFCLGTVPVKPTPKKPYDSYTQLLLDAHKLAVRYLSAEHMMGKTGCIAWFVKRPLLLTDVDALLVTIEAASAEASRLGPTKDFIQEVHDTRVAKIRGRYSTRYSQRVLRALPKPKFTRRWDTSLVEQIELDLAPNEGDPWEDNFVD